MSLFLFNGLNILTADEVIPALLDGGNLSIEGFASFEERDAFLTHFPKSINLKASYCRHDAPPSSPTEWEKRLTLLPEPGCQSCLVSPHLNLFIPYRKTRARTENANMGTENEAGRKRLERFVAIWKQVAGGE